MMVVGCFNMTKEEALQLASKWHLEREVENELKTGLPPEVALKEWSLY